MPDTCTRRAPERIRVKLIATGIAAAVLALLLTGLTLQTMREAWIVDIQARASYERMRTLWDLQDATRLFQKLSYKAARFDGAPADPAVAEARRNFSRLLMQMQTLSQRTPEQQTFAKLLQAQGTDVLVLVGRARQIAHDVEQIWRNQGYKAALAELTDLSGPYDSFFKTLTSELSAEGMKFSRATQRAADQQGAVRTLALVILVLGLLTAVTLFVALFKRLTLVRTNLALAAEDQRRRAFLVDASHELRLPVTIIRGEAQVALKSASGARSDCATDDALERIVDQTRALTRMLDDVFLIARAEARGLSMNLQRLDAGDLARRTAEEFSTLACETGSRVIPRCDVGLFVTADPDRLRQILAALIDNALRHTRAGVNILVEARHSEGDILLSVVDDGPGIDPTLRNQLFQRFRRGRTGGEGSGLGLAVVRALTEALGGIVGIAAAPRGAHFWVRLPRACTPARAVDAQGDEYELAASR